MSTWVVHQTIEQDSLPVLAFTEEEVTVENGAHLETVMAP